MRPCKQHGALSKGHVGVTSGRSGCRERVGFDSLESGDVGRSLSKDAADSVDGTSTTKCDPFATVVGNIITFGTMPRSFKAKGQESCEMSLCTYHV